MSHVNNLCRDNTRISFLATVNSPTFFDEIKEAYYCKLGLQNIASKNKYGIIKLNTVTKQLIIFNVDKYILFDSEVGDLDTISFSLKKNLSSDERHHIIGYPKLRMIPDTDQGCW